MANTIIKPEIFRKEVIRNLDRKAVIYPLADTSFSGDLVQAGDTVTVQTLPTLSFASGTAGAAITATDFTITSESLLIDTTKQLRVTLKDIEKKQSNLTLEQKVAMRFAEAEARLLDEAIRDQILVTQVADIPAGNKINSGSPITLTKTNIFEEIEKMVVQAQIQNAGEDAVLLLSPQAASYLRQSGLLDNTDSGLDKRIIGTLKMLSGLEVRVSNALTASKEMILMDRMSVNFVAQLNQFDVRQGVDGFYENLLAEVIYGLKIFGENAKRIVINYVA